VLLLADRPVAAHSPPPTEQTGPGHACMVKSRPRFAHAEKPEIAGENGEITSAVIVTSSALIGFGLAGFVGAFLWSGRQRT
jgi:hypothetical protein